MPDELLTGDRSQITYSSIRAGLVEFRRQINAVQWQLFIPMLGRPGLALVHQGRMIAAKV